MSFANDTRLDACFAQAAQASALSVAALYDSIDASDVRIGAGMDRRIGRAIRKSIRSARGSSSSRTARRALTGALIAATVGILLAFTVAAANTEQLWNAVVQWYENVFSLQLRDIPEEPDDAGDVEVVPPSYLGETYLPAGVTAGLRYGLSDMDVDGYRMLEYEFYDGMRTVCRFRQATLDFLLYPADIDGYERQRVDVGGGYGEFLTSDGDVVRTLIWSDDRYRYCLESDVLTEAELVAWAQSLAPYPGIFGTERTEIRKPSALPAGLREEMVGENPFHYSIFYFDGKSNICKFSQYPLGETEGGMTFLSEVTYDEAGVFSDAMINGYSAWVHESADGFVQVDWTDESYGYTLTSLHYDREEMLAIARSVRTVSAGPNRLEYIYVPKAEDSSVTAQITRHDERCFTQRYDKAGVLYCTYTQQITSQDLPSEPDGSYTEQTLHVHYEPASLRHYQSGERLLIWTDGQYRYVLESAVMDDATMLAWAGSVLPPTTVRTVCRPLLDGEDADVSFAVLSESAESVTSRYCHGERELFRLTQSVLWSQSIRYGAECRISDVQIGAFPGTMLRFSDGTLAVVWNDGSYRYDLQSGVCGEQELLAWAGRIAPVNDQPRSAEEPPQKIEELCIPDVSLYGWTQNVEENSDEVYTVAYYLGERRVGSFTQGVMAFPCLVRETSDTMTQYSEGARSIYKTVVAEGHSIVWWSDGVYRYRLELVEEYAPLWTVLKRSIR